MEYFDSWHTFDLHKYVESSKYYTQWAVVTTVEGQRCALKYADRNPGDSVRVVIEVEVPLSCPRLIEGCCLWENP